MPFFCSVIVCGQEKSSVFAYSAEIFDEVNMSPHNEVIPSFGQCLHV